MAKAICEINDFNIISFLNFLNESKFIAKIKTKFYLKEYEKHVANTHIFKARDGKCAVLIEIN